MSTEKENLVLSRLAYYDFNKEDMNHAINEIAYSGSTSKGISQWQNDIDQMSNWQLINYVNNNDTSGYCGAAFRNTETGEIIIANRGTEPSILNNSKLPADLITDLKIALVDNPLCKPAQTCPHCGAQIHIVE